MDEIRFAVECRADESRQSPGRIFGTLMEYETRAGDRPEMFAAGALTWPDGGVVLNEQHNRQAPIMRFTPEVRGSAVVIDSLLPDTQRGRDAALMIRNGTFRGLSVEFRSHVRRSPRWSAAHSGREARRCGSRRRPKLSRQRG